MLVGIDVAESAVWYASGRKVGFVARAAADHLPFRDGSFDAVTLIDVLYMLGHEDRAAVREAQRVLREGGLLVANTAAFEWLRGEHDAATGTRHRYRKEEVRGLLTGGGFEVRRLLYWNSLLLPAVAFVRNVVRPAPAKGGPPRSDIRSVPGWLNSLLAGLLSIDVMLAENIGFPLGCSVYCLAQKRPHNREHSAAPTGTAPLAPAERITASFLKASPDE
jgi:SAM-dependent methyltransferase